jgi:hypothetical protein
VTGEWIFPGCFLGSFKNMLHGPLLMREAGKLHARRK